MMHAVSPEAPSGLIVSIHDVSPLTWRRTDEMLADLQCECGVLRTSLLVIPNHHHRAPILSDESFCRWLIRQASAGHEIVVHGFYHSRRKAKSDGWRRLVTEYYTAGEGEFFDIRESEAAVLLAKARNELATLGLRPAGFIAPAWLLGSEGAKAVRDAGFQYTTRLDRIEDYASGKIYFSQSLCYSVRSGWRRACSNVWNSLLLRMVRRNPAIRIGLHPPDWSFPAIRAHALRCAVKALAGREAMPYDSWLQRQKAR